MKKLSTFGSSAVATALVLTLWGAAPSALADEPGASTPAAAASTVTAAPVSTATTADRKKPKPKRWKAYQGAFFNNPHVNADRFKIERRIIETLRHVPKGETVRIAAYSFDRVPMANALIAAHKRGVKIQMLLNDHQDTHAMKMVRAALGTNRYAKNFIYKCKQGCRTFADQYRNLHSKFYMFTRAGKSKDVMVVGSHNMTRNAIYHQWNDAYFMSGDKPLFDQFTGVFKDMKKDYNTKQPPIRFCGTPKGAACDDSVDKYTTWIFPKTSTSKSDVVLDMLRKIQCLTPDGSGGYTRTHLALSMHTMRGARGDYLASAIRQKWAEGCDFRVSYGLIGYHTKQILGASTARGRIPLRSTGLDYHPDDDFDLNHDGEDDVILDYYTHQKYFVIQGTYNGHPNTQMVLTGSSNWASLGTAEDEVFFTVRGATNAKRYLANFNSFWNNGHWSRNAYTTTYTDFRVARMERQADGSYKKVYVTERRPVTTVERDPARAGGRFWEGD
ncbi:MAG TPA: phospholipase D-like domain-containing protein [Nocardioides sp.]|nr:phospholipase D-like domain-containing protein [Nocardioides sp.]